MHSNELAPGLVEFGLSRYEAKAYLTLLDKGPLSVSEIAYYANMPRTKIYSTLKKLSKKGLAIITQDKPLVCTAVSPDYAFEELLSMQESKISEMRRIIVKLQKISEESNKAHGAEEHSYLKLDPDSVLATMNELILDAKEEVACVIDGWGLRIMSQCRDAILRCVTNQISIKILVSKECLENDALSSIPYGASVRVGDGGTNLFVLDKSIIVMVNSSNGKAALFRSTDILSGVHSRLFDIVWANGMDARFLIPLGTELAKTTIKLLSAISHGAYGYIADSVISDGVKHQDIIHILESDGIKLSSIGLSDMLRIINAALGIICSASLKYNKNSNIITIESNGHGRDVMPLVLLLTNYLTHNDIVASTLSGVSNGKDFVHIKIAKKVTSR